MPFFPALSETWANAGNDVCSSCLRRCEKARRLVIDACVGRAAEDDDPIGSKGWGWCGS